MLVQHEIIDGPFQPCTGTDIIVETRTCNFGSSFRIEDAQVFPYIPVIERLEIKGRQLSPFADFRIFTVILADGNRGMAHVRYHELNGKHISFHFLYLFIESIDIITEFFHSGDFIVSIFLIPFQLADFLRDRIAFILHGFDALQQITALSVQNNKCIDIGRFRMTVLDVFLNFFRMFTDKFRI